MSNKYINFYNNLVNLSRNNKLYVDFINSDTFSDRLTFFLFHFAFFLKTYKQPRNKITLQEIYDYSFKQIELSIREIGYGDTTINKKMKNYLNSFYAILDKIDNWENLGQSDKERTLSNFLENNGDTRNLVNYFDKYRLNLLNNTLNSFIKGVVKP